MTIVCIIFGIISILLFASVVSLRDDLSKVQKSYCRDIERLKNWRMVQEHNQQITETALDMLFTDRYAEVEMEVRH